MNRIKQIVLAVSALAVTPFANSALITTQLENMTNGGGFFGELTFEDTALDTVKISADIAAPINAGLTKGDILGLWFDFADFSALSGAPTISGEDPSGIVTEVFFGENSIGSQLAGYSNPESVTLQANIPRKSPSALTGAINCRKIGCECLKRAA
jgi:hypothetical protein